MTNLRVDTIRSRDGNNGPIFEGNLSFSSTAHIVLPKGTTAERPVGVSTGSMRYNTDTSVVEYYNGTTWVQTIGYARDRGVFGGGNDPSASSRIEYITISSTGNSTIFGSLTQGRNTLAACASKIRGVFGGGNVTAVGYQNTIDYITISTTGNASDFGDLTQTFGFHASCSNNTRGIFGSGLGTPSNTTTGVINYVTISTVGNALSFGNLTSPYRYGLSACASSTRGVFGGGVVSPSGANTNTIDYITIETTGNATDFGDLTISRRDLAACSSNTRGVFGGGDPTTNTIDYITIATTGNATDFGDLTSGRFGIAACSSSTRGVFGGSSNIIDYITIATTGNAIDFGDLTIARPELSACSDCHGGLS